MPTETQLEQRVAALQSDLNAKDQALDDAATENKERELSRRSWFDEAQRLQAELAERDALLGRIYEASEWARDAVHYQEVVQKLVYDALSASAEQSAKPCEHEWTDDGEFLLICTVCGAQEDHSPGWRDIATAPRDGTMLRLLVEFEEHSTEDEDQAPTIGANNFENDEIDEWKFAGWCWSHDHFVEGKGTPVGWLPMLDSKPTEGAPVQRDERSGFNAWLNEVVYTENTDNGVFKVQCHQQLSVDDERIAWDAWQARAALERKP